MKVNDSFDTNAYYTAQMQHFEMRVSKGDSQIIEFGGKPFGDFHAARVLPGYDPDIKARILGDLTLELGNVSIAMTLHAQDVLCAPDGRRTAQRIRGYTGLRYDSEVIRLADQSRNTFGLPLETVVLTSVPSSLSAQNIEYINEYTERLVSEGLTVKKIGQIAGYPWIEVNNIIDTLTQFEPVSEQDHLIVISPGGGSGKFCVAATDIAHRLIRGGNPNFIKFETFPVFSLPTSHPLNVAFLAATADLPNELVTTVDNQTNYDKDVQNLSILKAVISHFPNLNSPLRNFTDPTDMGINVITEGIVNSDAITNACLKEIIIRIKRYSTELENGDEDESTVARTVKYLDSLLAD
jgi:uncharacterized protein (UPF0371 family)